MVGPEAAIAKPTWVMLLSKLLLVLGIFKFDSVETISPTTFSVKILALWTILSLDLNRGYWCIDFIPENFAIKLYLRELLKIKTLSNFLFFSSFDNLKNPPKPSFSLSNIIISSMWSSPANKSDAF